MDPSTEYLSGLKQYRRTAYADIRMLKRIQRKADGTITAGRQMKLDEIP